MEILALLVVGALIWQIVAYHKRQNDEFLARKWHYENQEANRLEEERRRVESARIERLTDEELDAELDQEDVTDGEEEEAGYQDAVREVQEVMGAVYKGH